MTDADSEEVADILKNLVDDKDADSESKKNGMSTDSVSFNSWELIVWCTKTQDERNVYKVGKK